MTNNYSIIHSDLMNAETDDEKYGALIQAIEYLSTRIRELESGISCYAGCVYAPASTKTYQKRARWLPPVGEIDLKTPLKNASLTVRTQNNCINVGVFTIEDLTNSSEEDLVRTRRFGKKSLDEIKDFLHGYGLSLKAPSDILEGKE